MAYDPEEIRMETARAMERWRATQQKLAELPNEVGIGQLFYYAATAELGIEWAVIHQHPDDPQLWFCLPFDQEPLVGTWDIAVGELSESGSGSLRCGRGIWIHQVDFRIDDRVGQLDQQDVEAARRRLADMVEGTPVPVREEVDFDPEYQDWMDALTAAVDALETQLHSNPEISLRSLNQDWVNEPGIHGNSGVTLAAEGHGLAAPPDTESSPPPGVVLPSDLPGKLVLVQESQGYRLQYHGVGDETPPAIMVTTSLGDQSCEWKEVVKQFHEATWLIPLDTWIEISLENGARLKFGRD